MTHNSGNNYTSSFNSETNKWKKGQGKELLAAFCTPPSQHTVKFINSKVPLSLFSDFY
jgi:hypothetical protein